MILQNSPGTDSFVRVDTGPVASSQGIITTQQDTVSVDLLQDTLQVLGNVSLPDTIISRGLQGTTIHDTTGTVPQDTILQPIADTTETGPQDTILPPIADTTGQDLIRQPLVTGQEVHIDVRSQPPSPPTDEKDSLYIYDPSWYLENESGPSNWNHRFSLTSEKDRTVNYPDRPVFIETGPSIQNNSSGAYNEYISMNGAGHTNSEAIQLSGPWVPVMVILSFLLLTWIKLIYVQFLTPVIVSAFNFKQSSKLFYEKNAPATNAFIILHLIFAINGGLFFLFVARHYNLRMPDYGPVILFLISSASLVALFGLKSFALSTLGYLFDKQKLFSEYNHNISLYKKVYGLVLLPVIVGLLYAGEQLLVPLILGGLIMGIIFYLLQLIRGLEIIIRKEFSLFYLILYLCAFEILPILVLYKLFQVFLL